MKTTIYKTWTDFYNRTDKEANGVSPEFAAAHPDYEKENESNKGSWNCSRCSDCSGCSGCSDCSRCSDCSGCSGCSDCSDCSDCSGCSRCSGLKNARPVAATEPKDSWMQVPAIPNIHQRILEAVSKPDALDMSTWHTCDTTHCRAGWAVFLAGEAGKKLEAQTGTVFAAMQIFKKSSPVAVAPPRFYESNEVALADIERCAKEEAAASVASK